MSRESQGKYCSQLILRPVVVMIIFVSINPRDEFIHPHVNVTKSATDVILSVLQDCPCDRLHMGTAYLPYPPSWSLRMFLIQTDMSECPDTLSSLDQTLLPVYLGWGESPVYWYHKFLNSAINTETLPGCLRHSFVVCGGSPTS
ncbi:hypothetical protein Mapa_012545 [Marchantia paleacea]|nr:hypothetical protein Mapa_012545 [Marchantia paleacea]